MELSERSHQLDLLARRLGDLRRPAGQAVDARPVIALTGPVGAGKTTLLQALARRATDAGVRFLGASASRAERAVPLEVVRQLVRATPPDDARARLERLLDQGVLTWSDLDDGQEGPARTIAAIGGALLELAARGPLVIGIDDVHHADVPSLRCLDYVARRIPGLPVLIVLTEAPRTRPWHPEVYAELLQPARLHRIRVPLLTLDGTHRALADRLGAPTARSIAEETHRISGGNPLLVQALADDHLAAVPRGAARPESGEAFREAVLSCLYRCEHLVLKAARALAVTDEPLHGALLPQLVDVRAESALLAIDEATSAGLITEGGLRHPAVGRAVLDGTTAEERARLHRLAACLLHEDGESPVLVARHLLRTDSLAEPWMARTLLDAGEQALLDGEVDAALRFLRRAHRDGTDECLRARARSALARAEWRLDPQGAMPHLQGVASAVRAGHLGSTQAAGPIQYLLWHGQIDKAVELVRHLGDRADSSDPRSAAELLVTKGWMATLYPGVTIDHQAPVPARRDPLTIAKVKQRLQGVTMLASVLERGDGGAVEEAERVLSTIGLDDERDMWTAICALITMIYADRLDLAGEWCGRLGRSATVSRHPTPAAMLAALDAAIAGRRGDLTRAQELADTALNQLSPKGWGVVIGIPLAIRLRALTFLGELDAAAACLQVPVPQVLFETPFGLHYLHARGLHALATGSPESALADFQLCGQLMAAWRLDLPALIPWRTESARALLQLGRRPQAEKLVREELGRLRPGHVRYRAAALRVLAAAEDGRDPIPHLRGSVRLLRQCGDRMELAHSLTDLGHAYQQAGDLRQARKATRAARTLAQECGLPLLRPAAAPGRGGPAGADPDVAVLVEGLSDTESRVATLAAQGHTNREIAEKLFLTVSAIEQRLTRIYRKLDVDSRRQLAVRLRLDRPGAMPAERLGAPRKPPGRDGDARR
ncbi:AAA family ATPase [Micromonospora carbonacea]|uniref:AAA family ATPase n=1 Tax=Micromonospora carbonacea TaxID=47853 RepID=A0A7H8XJ61_9ACTN|nr:LuxR family transcriptional regulator [Micromonospora carbonacea]MBB5827693.1 DNA-binding CsgD family transcriptional regulator/energy-coupling factor transporter ATP-binding protein EcfA2 [Micromonospora carbonacea]QLD24578.1 AAA family ATPase [Micromonospora carbonacea]